MSYDNTLPGYPASFWQSRLNDSLATGSENDKYLAVFSLILFLDISIGPFLLWIFTSTLSPVRIRAAAFLRGNYQSKDEDARFYPAAIYRKWHEWNNSHVIRSRLHEHIIEPCALELAVTDSDRVIQDKDFRVKLKTLTVDGIKKIFEPNKLADKYKQAAPFLWNVMMAAVNAPNEYRKKKEKKKKGREGAGKQSGPAREVGQESEAGSGERRSLNDASSDWDDDPEDLTIGENSSSKPEGFSRNPIFPVMVSIAMLTFARNRATNVIPLLLGLFFRIGGTSTRVMTLLSNIGLSVSTSTIERLKETISDDAIQHAKALFAGAVMFYVIFDNINIFLRKFQQRLTNKNTLLHATNSAVIAIEGVSPDADDLQTKKNLRGNRKNATKDDVLPTSEDDKLLLEAMESQIASLLLQFCPGNRNWKDRAKMREEIERSVPRDRPLEPKKTDARPFGVFDINEGSKKGIVKVLEAIQERSGLSRESWSSKARRVVGDWLTSSNLRSARFDRVDDVNSMERLEYVEELSALFHFALQATHMLMRVHYGNATTDPVSLAAHKGLLDRKWDVQKPNYAAAKSLIRHSLIARLLLLVMIQKKYTTYKQLEAWRPSIDELKTTAKTITADYATSTGAHKAKKANDDWSAHNIFFVRDALIFCIFENAVSYADAGWVIRVLKYWALSFRGARQHNYARECVEIILRWKYEMSDAMRASLERSWFYNRFGRIGGFIASDLYLEQLNYWVKRVFIAQGNGVTIEYIIKKGSACVEAFRDISHLVARYFGDPDRARRSKETKFHNDIKALVEEMVKKDLHQFPPPAQRHVPKIPTPGKKTSSKKPGKPLGSAVVDVFDQGAQDWSTGKLTDYIKTTTFDPAVGMYPVSSTSDSSSASVSHTGTPFDNPAENPLDYSGYEDLHGNEDEGGIGGGENYSTGDDME